MNGWYGSSTPGAGGAVMITLRERRLQAGQDQTGQDPARQDQAADDSQEILESLMLVGCGDRTSALMADFQAEGVEARGFRTDSPDSGELPDDPPDVLVIGPGVQGMGGRISRPPGFGSVPVLYLAPDASPASALEAAALGADDALPPPHSSSAIRFRATLLVVRRRAAIPDAENPRFGVVEVDLGGRRLLKDGIPVMLSGREFQLLERLLAAKGEVVGRRMLLTDIWGADQVSEGVLDATIHRLRSKLEEDVSEPRYLTTVRGVGYRLEGRTAPQQPADRP